MTMLLVEYDNTVDAAYVSFRKAVIVSTEEIAPGVMLDMDETGHAVGIEFLNASEIFGRAA